MRVVEGAAGQAVACQPLLHDDEPPRLVLPSRGCVPPAFDDALEDFRGNVPVGETPEGTPNPDQVEHPRRTAHARTKRGWLAARVVGPVNIPEISAIDMCVNLRGRDIRMPEHLLHRSQVGSSLQEVRGERVP